MPLRDDQIQRTQTLKVIGKAIMPTEQEQQQNPRSRSAVLRSGEVVMLESQDRYPLQNIILDDLFSANKTLIALLFLIVMTALGTIWITHQTRILVAENGQLVLEHQALENEYLNLKLEEATQSDNTRIEAIARQLGMKRVEPEQEVLILE